MPKTTVIVTNSHFDSGVYASGALSRKGYDVVGADFGRLALGLRSRFLRAQREIARTGETAMQRDLLRIVRSERPAVLLPIGTRFVHAAIVLRERLEEAGVRVNVPDLDAYFAAYGKSRCMDECARLGIPRPRVFTFEEARDRLAGGEFAVVVKPDFDAGGAQGVRYARTPQALEKALDHCRRDYGPAVIEEHIPGGPERMLAATLLFDSRSRLAAAFTIQKLRHWPLDGGLTAYARSTADADIVRQVLPLFERWRWRGAAEVELKRDPRDGVCKVIEVNPRFPAYLRFAGACGLDFPDLAVRLSLGEETPPAEFPAYAVSEAHCSPDAYLRSVAAELRGGLSRLATLREALGELRDAAPALVPLALDPAPVIGRVVTNLTAPHRVKTRFHPIDSDASGRAGQSGHEPPRFEAPPASSWDAQAG